MHHNSKVHLKALLIKSRWCNRSIPTMNIPVIVTKSWRFAVINVVFLWKMGYPHSSSSIQLFDGEHTYVATDDNDKEWTLTWITKFHNSLWSTASWTGTVLLPIRSFKAVQNYRISTSSSATTELCALFAGTLSMMLEREKCNESGTCGNTTWLIEQSKNDISKVLIFDIIDCFSFDWVLFIFLSVFTLHHCLLHWDCAKKIDDSICVFMIHRSWLSVY